MVVDRSDLMIFMTTVSIEIDKRDVTLFCIFEEWKNCTLCDFHFMYIYERGRDDGVKREREREREREGVRTMKPAIIIHFVHLSLLSFSLIPMLSRRVRSLAGFDCNNQN